jgi:hypothetical protein
MAVKDIQIIFAMEMDQVMKMVEMGFVVSLLSSDWVSFDENDTSSVGHGTGSGRGVGVGLGENFGGYGWGRGEGHADGRITIRGGNGPDGAVKINGSGMA